ncbi:MAG: arginase family protein, partial [Planctomycetota bacterium]
IRDLGLAAYTLADVERRGIARVCEEAFDRVTRSTKGYVLSFDLDAVDPSELPGVYYKEPGGLTYREAHVLMEHAARTDGLVALEVVEYFPAADRDTITAVSAAQLIRTAMGGRIL